MTRLQKKCLIAVAGTHLLVVVVVLCSGFIRPSPKPDNVQVLEAIPSQAIDALLSSGVRNPQPPTPIVTPPVTPPEPPQPVRQEPPKPVVKPEPVTPVPVEPVVAKSEERPDPKPPKHEVKVDLTRKVIHTPTKEHDNSAAEEAEKQAKEQKKLQDQKKKAFQSAINNLKNNFSSATEVNMPGASSVSYANYGTIVVSVYHRSWVAPEHMANDSAVVSFSVTIARDGHVISSHIENPSGDSNVNNAVQRMLDRVPFIHEFPADTTDRERTYHIDFNATRTSIQ